MKIENPASVRLSAYISEYNFFFFFFWDKKWAAASVLG